MSPLLTHVVVETLDPGPCSFMLHDGTHPRLRGSARAATTAALAIARPGTTVGVVGVPHGVVIPKSVRRDRMAET